ncbi:MAG: hypothetical protein V1816_02670 [Pseudomonadota bacterium]
MGTSCQKDTALNLNSDDLEKLLASVRKSDGYLEMEMKIRQLVQFEGARPLERLILTPDVVETDDSTRRRTRLNEVQHDLTAIIVKKVADLDSLSLDERLFMMLMIEDIVREIVREAAARG